MHFITPKNMHINIYNSIKVSFLDSEPINTISVANKGTIDKNTCSHLGIHIHEVSKDTRSPPSHLFPIYIRYMIIIGTNHTYNNGRVNLQKTHILK